MSIRRTVTTAAALALAGAASVTAGPVTGSVAAPDRHGGLRGGLHGGLHRWCEARFDAAVERYRQTTFAKDADGFNALLDDDVVVVLANGSTLIGKRATAEFVDGFFADPAWTQTLDVVHTTVEGCRAGFVLFDSELVMTPGATPEPLAIGVTFVWQHGRWRVLHNQDSTGPVS